ncbi:oxidoreductase [Subtercola lobariae]|uniref:Oxidoreductase n=1 Tax=Subtercola lobariae TaxID=1588641 RepID=A0A917BAY2_9MICO|nr:oxidoreductase [Subtercola lobariae]GGF31763.1 oxidoreductase [Subtercola lobariae]
MSKPELPGGTLTLAPELTVSRVGYGAMQLAGHMAFGPPADRAAAIAVLRTAVELGVTHIDSSDYYGPYVVNEIIREALHPYGDTVHIATKVGFLRNDQGAWIPALTPDELRKAVHSNLEHLGLDALDLVNLRVGAQNQAAPGSLEGPFTVLAELQQQGLIKNIGLSTVSAEQVAEARRIAPVLAVQNYYNLAQRTDDDLIDSLAEDGIAFVPYAPLGGGFDPLKAQELDTVAARHDASPLGIALAWLLNRSPNILLIPGTSSLAHLYDNVSSTGIVLTDEDLADLELLSDKADARS